MRQLDTPGLILPFPKVFSLNLIFLSLFLSFVKKGLQIFQLFAVPERRKTTITMIYLKLQGNLTFQILQNEFNKISKFTSNLTITSEKKICSHWSWNDISSSRSDIFAPREIQNELKSIT